MKKVRSVPVWFIKEMERKLQIGFEQKGYTAWDRKWEGCELGVDYFIEYLKGEVAELEEAYSSGKGSTEVVRECADVANLAMFVADIAMKEEVNYE